MVSFELIQGSAQQAKAQSTASTAAALSSTGATAAAAPADSDGDRSPADELKPASAPDHANSDHGMTHAEAFLHADPRLSASLPATSQQLAAQVQDSVEWGLHHHNIEAYPSLNVIESQQGSTFADASDGSSHAAFKKAASWCSPAGASMAMHAMSAPASDVPETPIRLLTAAQFARMQQQYLDQDVPHHVVFPFLHGVDGDNPAQNVFFGAPLGGQPTPRYRGLTVVRADMPSPETLLERYHAQRKQRSAPIPIFPASSSHSFGMDPDHFSHTGAEARLDHSQSKSNSSCSSDGSDESSPSSEGSCCSDVRAHERESSNSMYEHFAANISMASSNTTAMSHSSGNSFFSDKIAGQSFQSDTASTFSSSSPNPVQLGDKAPITEAAEAFEDKPACTGSPMDVSFPDFCGSMLTRPYEPQPSHSILNSTLFPCELVNIPIRDEQTRPRSSTSASGPPSPSKQTYKRLSGPTASPTDSTATLDSPDLSSAPTPKASFVRPQQSAGVSLRNFKIQAAKYATISDIVVYCPAGLHSGAIELAKHCRDAQEEMYQERMERGLGGLRYNVFIVTDSFDVFERQFDHLVAVDSHGRQHQAVSFLDREREEMQRLTRASEIDHNVWLGCSKDVPPLDPHDQEITNVADRSNPHGFNFCIEAHEMAYMPGDETLRRASAYLDALERISAGRTSGKSGNGEGQDYFGLFEAEGHASNSASPPPPPSPSSSIIHLECASSSQGCSNNESLSRMADDIIEFCAWIKAHACPDQAQMQDQFGPTAAAARPRRFLIHCGDGYTETSIMGLSYLMFSRELSLPEAYLDLQHRADRSFFLYARDLSLLKRVDDKLAFIRRIARQAEEEARLRAEAAQKPKPKHSFPWLSSSAEESKHAAHGRMQSASECTSNSEHSSWAKSLAAAASGLVSPNQPSQHRKALSFASATTAALSRNARNKRSPASPCSPMTQREDPMIKHAWFHNPRFEGSFPSRILPFLYLGNLNHAMNADMLHALGITHVVSVGESALHPPPDAYCTTSEYSWEGEFVDPSVPCASNFGDAALWHEVQAGRINVLDLKNVSDDGIDSLRSTMRESVEYIESARRSGGKVLVHCRVGVSRSATIVLAYAMAHLDLSLVEAYLLVRSRRLNILIQPHLLFFWELRSWEKCLSDQKQLRMADATPSCLPSEPSLRQCPEIEYKDIDEEMTDADVPPASEADDRAFSMAALSLCSFTPGTNHTATFGHSNSGAASPAAAYIDTPPSSLEHGEDLLDVDLAAGAGSVYGRRYLAPEKQPFGSGSPAGIPFESLRLTWGFLCREIAALNERYCV
ncbi:tyrosine/serine/threonine protein phosphatase pps1 [Tilletia horrida]|uniref:Tyrosine/serine/threonine protein phosphatase pps1 n=1 Tax=Tilletia horrida TaxID=155126 RepID=A0AAN6GGR4_9BASI|nr:tyrosine/serine/threonine protein phosphatase pps1 [Tilletia horrida]KAK0538490.1 tyrosine/serine/threonine protein phosphatase pps1 [Tilletia horrida]